jgi:hypothetical protein
MQRYNGFTLIHKALRALLYDTALTLQQTYFADIDEAEPAIEKVETVLFLFERHAHHEDTFLLPAVATYEPRLVDEFENEHDENIMLGNRLKNLLNIYRNIYFTEERVVCGGAINKAFVEFMVFNLEHMAKEEILLNQALWKHYTDEQLVELNQKLVATIPAEEKAIAFKWMMRGINYFDAVNWMHAVKKTAPDFVFNSLINLAEAELPQHRLEKLHEGLTEDAILV